jgi:methyl-branched lipid omega-hydroxylase
MQPVRNLSVDEIDLTDMAFWTRPDEEREGAFATLREERPIAFFNEPETVLFPTGPGYWSLARHADVLEVSKHPQLFCSGRGINIPDLPVEFMEFFSSMIAMDDPKHARLRRIVSAGFTPKMLNSMKADVEQAAAEVVDGIIEKGECDFVSEIAALLPLRIIVDLMGIPRSEELGIFHRSNVVIGFTDGEYVPDNPDGTLNEMAVTGALVTAGQELAQLVTELAEDRKRNPRNDLTTALVNAEVDGDSLTPQEIGSFFILLVVAGNETTRNAIAHGLHVLTEHPDQRQRLIDDYDALAPTAVEEIVRWASPVIHFRRTVTQDGVRVGDHTFNEGDKVVLWYNSANRDDAVINDPYTFDITRSPNEHVGFGGPGPHFCLGAHLARREITVMFRELFRRIPDIHATAPPDRLRSNFINGIKHLPAAFTPGGVTR